MDCHRRCHHRRLPRRLAITTGPTRTRRRCRLFGIAPIGPLTGAGVASRDAWLVGVEIRLDQPSDSGEPLQRRVVEIAQRDAQAVDLRERDFTSRERVGDPAALLEEPVPVVAGVEHSGLDRPCLARRNAAEAGGRAAHQDAIRAEHRAFGIDGDAAASTAARMQPAHCCEHRPAAAAIWRALLAW